MTNKGTLWPPLKTDPNMRGWAQSRLILERERCWRQYDATIDRIRRAVREGDDIGERDGQRRMEVIKDQLERILAETTRRAYR